MVGNGVADRWRKHYLSISNLAGASKSRLVGASAKSIACEGCGISVEGIDNPMITENKRRMR